LYVPSGTVSADTSAVAASSTWTLDT
jgi:hypothetical protein